MRPNPQFTADLVTFTEEILNGKLHFLCIEITCTWASYESIHRTKIFDVNKILV